MYVYTCTLIGICTLARFILRKEIDKRCFPLQIIQLFPGLSIGLGEVNFVHLLGGGAGVV